MSIQYTALGFEPTTSLTCDVTHNHKTRALNLVLLFGQDYTYVSRFWTEINYRLKRSIITSFAVCADHQWKTFVSWPLWPEKKSPNVYKSCPKIISLEKWQILTPLQKCLRMWEIWEINCCQRLQKVAQSPINTQFWSHCSWTTLTGQMILLDWLSRQSSLSLLVV